MKKEIKITPPEGWEIDKENSTFECIKFKPVEKPWRYSNPCVKGFYLGAGRVKCWDGASHSHWDNSYHDVFATEKQAKSALAMAMISQIMANDPRFGGVVTDEEWTNIEFKYTINRFENRIMKPLTMNNYAFLAFHTAEQRDLFLEENEDLVKDYLMID